MGTPGVYAGLVIAGYVLLCWVCWYRFRQRQRALGLIHGEPLAATLVIYASQTGRAAELAQQTTAALQAADIDVTLLPINRLNQKCLQHAQRLFFCVSTYGEGDPPDMAADFTHRYLERCSLDLSHLSYGVLALGDKEYANFCAFGRQLDCSLETCGARRLFDRIEMDGEDVLAVHQWQQQIQTQEPSATFSATTPSYHSGTLSQRRCLNTGSPGAPVFHLSLNLEQPLNWQAGDIVSVLPRNSAQAVARFLREIGVEGDKSVAQEPSTETLSAALEGYELPHHGSTRQALMHQLPDELLGRLRPIAPRDYSIASLPEDGQVELVVRQMRYPDGGLGLASGWLTEHLPVGGRVQLHLRNNPAFHGPPPQVPLILIGNGTGIAGLRAHLKARHAVNAAPNWLLFGERTEAHDSLFRAELEQWRDQGHLQRLDRAFSRDGGACRYVQDLLVNSTDELTKWLEQGAAIYVCGSKSGMAQDVDITLVRLLGAQAVTELREQGRYRRDVY